MEEQELKNAVTAIRNFMKLKAEFDYDSLLKEFLNVNILAEEKDFIHLEIERASELIDELREIADFYFMDDIETDAQYESIKARDYYWYYQQYLAFLQSKLTNRSRKVVDGLGDLTAAELAIRHLYLEKAKKVDDLNLNGAEVGRKYGHLKSSKNIETEYNHFYNKRKTPNKTQLQNVYDSISEHPTIQKAIENDIDKLQ